MNKYSWTSGIINLGKEEGVWHIDLKNGAGACGQGEPSNPPDATLTMDAQNFADMFAGIWHLIFILKLIKFKN